MFWTVFFAALLANLVATGLMLGAMIVFGSHMAVFYRRMISALDAETARLDAASALSDAKMDRLQSESDRFDAEAERDDAERELAKKVRNIR